jgi:hypothetical protein
LEDLDQAVPVDGVKGLCEVKLDHQRWRLAFVAELDELCWKHEILQDGAAFDKSCLIGINQPCDLQLQSRGEQFCLDLFFRKAAKVLRDFYYTEKREENVFYKIIA